MRGHLRAQAAALGTTPSYGSHAASLLPAGGYSSDVDTSDTEEGRPTGAAANSGGPIGRPEQRRIRAHTLFAWRDPVSPHIAVEREGVRASVCPKPCIARSTGSSCCTTADRTIRGGHAWLHACNRTGTLVLTVCGLVQHVAVLPCAQTPSGFASCSLRCLRRCKSAQKGCAGRPVADGAIQAAIARQLAAFHAAVPQVGNPVWSPLGLRSTQQTVLRHTLAECLTSCQTLEDGIFLGSLR